MTHRQESNDMAAPSLVTDPAAAPHAEVLFHVLWAVGRPGSGWDRFPSIVAGFNCQMVEQYPDDYADQRRAAEQNFTRLADVEDAFFFVTPMVCSLPRLPELAKEAA